MNDNEKLAIVIIAPFILPIISYYLLLPETFWQKLVFGLVAIAEYFFGLILSVGIVANTS